MSVSWLWLMSRVRSSVQRDVDSLLSLAPPSGPLAYYGN